MGVQVEVEEEARGHCGTKITMVVVVSGFAHRRSLGGI
jgi:hypothetical protein